MCTVCRRAARTLCAIVCWRCAGNCWLNAASFLGRHGTLYSALLSASHRSEDSLNNICLVFVQSDLSYIHLLFAHIYDVTLNAALSGCHTLPDIVILSMCVVQHAAFPFYSLGCGKVLKRASVEFSLTCTHHRPQDCTAELHVI